MDLKGTVKLGTVCLYENSRFLFCWDSANAEEVQAVLDVVGQENFMATIPITPENGFPLSCAPGLITICGSIFSLS